MMKHLFASFMFFTRLPFWRLASVPADSFKHVVPYWPVVGWLTGGVLAGVFWLTAGVFPAAVAWLLAVVARLFITGCLHEDGLADFCDGFGGGVGRERVLAIMKDSHIGAYGVVGLVLYFLLLSRMSVLPSLELCAVAFCADAYAKWCASQIVNVLPYARKEEESKARVVYARMSAGEFVAGLVGGWLPLFLFLPAGLWWACLCPPAVFVLLCLWMRRRVGGYTGDCCGAVFLLCELSFYLAVLALVRMPML